MKDANMHIAELAMYRKLDHVYRCDSMPEHRGYWFRAEGGDFYVKPDGTLEPFDFRVEMNKYAHDSTWRLLGTIPRRAPDGALVLELLPALLSK